MSERPLTADDLRRKRQRFEVVSVDRQETGGAARTRRYRDRQRAGVIRLVNVPVSRALLQSLVKAGLLPSDTTAFLDEEIAEALAKAAYEMLTASKSTA